ncbi:MAG: DedA family protein [Anaerolineaceae bacterium]
MNELAIWVIVTMTQYGIPILLFFCFIGSLGIPFPVTLVIVTAGAFTRQGLLDWHTAALACLAGAALADHSEYLLGRWAGPWLKKRIHRESFWHDAEEVINRQGGWSILLTRFWLTPLAPAINMIAGSRYPYLHFLAYDIAGQLLWVFIYGGLGYIFAGQIILVMNAVGTFSGLSLGLVILGVGLYLILRRRRQAQSLSE